MSTSVYCIKFLVYYCFSVATTKSEVFEILMILELLILDNYLSVSIFKLRSLYPLQL